jgi:WD40 repeat protein
VSSSRDKYGLIYDLSNSSTISFVPLDNSAAVFSMTAEIANERFFVGLASGDVKVFSYSRDNFKLLTTLSGHAGIVRSLHFEVSDQYLFSGGFDNSVMIWKIGTRGDESSESKRVGILRGGPPSKIKAVNFSSKRRQVFAGHQNGALTVWNTRDGSVLNVICPHAADIVDLIWNEEKEQLISCSRDGFTNVWSFKSDHAKNNDVPIFEKKDLYAKIMLAE